MAKEQATYSHGHHSSVVKSHALRTAQDSAGFLVPHIKPIDNILDVGCGPGSITVDLARLVPQGKVTGVDAVESVLDQARELATSRGLTNITFESVDANNLPYPDNSFDIVYCHQVLQHVKDPISILKEMRRVAKPGGIVAARESDYLSFAWYPEHQGISRWAQLYQEVAKANGGEPNAGRVMHTWARKAGFDPEHIQNTVTSWCYTGQRAIIWANSWADRALYSEFNTTAKKHNLTNDEGMQKISDAWKEWATMEDLWFAIPSGEMLYRVPAS